MGFNTSVHPRYSRSEGNTVVTNVFLVHNFIIRLNLSHQKQLKHVWLPQNNWRRTARRDTATTWGNAHWREVPAGHARAASPGARFKERARHARAGHLARRPPPRTFPTERERREREAARDRERNSLIPFELLISM